MTIEVSIEVLSKTASDSTIKRAVSSLSSSVQGIKTSSSSEAANLRAMHIDGDTLALNIVKTVGLVTGVCGNGAVYGVDAKNAQTVGKCSKYFFIPVILLLLISPQVPGRPFHVIQTNFLVSKGREKEPILLSNDESSAINHPPF